MRPARNFFETSDLVTSSGAPLRIVPATETWHALDTEVVLAKLGTNPSSGLTTAESKQRRLRYGSNALQKIRPRPAWRLLVDQFASVVIALLAVAAAVAWITGDVLEAIAILVVLVINALVGFATEYEGSAGPRNHAAV